MAYKLSRKKTKKYGGAADEKPLSMDKVVIHENNGYATGTVTLNGKDDAILIDNGRLLFVEQESKPDDQVNIKSIVQGSAIKSLKRSFLSSENIFINKFTGSDSGKPVKVHFGAAAPGDIIKIVVKPNESYTLSSGTFIASSSNLNITAKLNLRGIISGEGIGLTLVKNKSTRDGYIFIGCFGKASELKVKPGSEVLIDNGSYLASKNVNGEKAYTLTKLKGIKSFFLSGEGILMKFKNKTNEEMTIYTQSRNLHNFAGVLKPYLPGKN